MSVVIHQNSLFSMPCGLSMGRKKQKAEQESTKPEDELASLRKKMTALSSVISPEALSGGASPGEGAIHPPRPAQRQVESDTERSETVPRTTSNLTRCEITMTGVSRRGMEPIGSSPPRFDTGLERISHPMRLATTRAKPNTVESEIGPHTKKGSASAVSNSNDASTNNAISHTTSRHDEMKSKVTPNPDDTLLPRSTGSRRSRKKKPRTPPVSLLTHGKTQLHGPMRKVLYHPLSFVHEQIHRRESPQRMTGRKDIYRPSRKPPANEAVADFNRERMRLGLDADISALSELEISSTGIVSSPASPLPTVEEHEATITNDDTRTPDPIMPTRPSGRIASKRSGLVTHIGNRVGSMKREVNVRMAKFGRMAVKNFSPTNSTIRLPSPSTEALSNMTVVNPPTVITPQVDPPETSLSLDDAPDYQESKTLLQDWERKMSEEHSSESQSHATISRD